MTHPAAAAPPAAKVVGLFLTHTLKGSVGRHFRKLKRESVDYVRWRTFFDPANAVKRPGATRRAARSLMPARFHQIGASTNMMEGYLDVPIIAAALRTGADYVWACKYDVDWSGDWAGFFRAFADNEADLLTTTVRTRRETPDWHYWGAAAAPAAAGAQDGWLRAFHPIMRLSRRLMECYAEEVGRPGWEGHYEWLLPTIAQAHGLTFEDIGGEGPFCPAARRGLFYSNSAREWLLSPGTFVWRPSLDRYAWERGSDRAPSMLYHPVKSGQAEWERVAKANGAAYDRLRHQVSHKQYLAALATARTVRPSYLAGKLVSRFAARSRNAGLQ